MNKIETQIKFGFIFELERHEDDRGWLMELYRSDEVPFMKKWFSGVRTGKDYFKS